MSTVYVTADLHLGHNNIHKHRPEFSSAEEHHEIIFDNLASTVTKNDTLYLLGDVAFSKEWLARIANLKVKHKILIAGNHDLERGIHMRDLVETYDAVYALWTKRNFWLSHAPIHPQELRNKKANIHGHLHGNMVWADTKAPTEEGFSEIDQRYINVSLEHTDWKPIKLSEATIGY
jgi:calcineurin-like phosphoesterase family protein